MHNTARRSATCFGDDLQKLLLRFPNVVLHASGHSHSNRVWTRKNKQLGTGYWEVATPSLIDAPHSGRTVELVRNADGTISISSTLFEPRVDPEPAPHRLEADDPTDETKFGAKRHINEDWLAALGLEAAEASRDEKRFGKTGRPQRRARHRRSAHAHRRRREGERRPRVLLPATIGGLAIAVLASAPAAPSTSGGRAVDARSSRRGVPTTPAKRRVTAPAPRVRTRRAA